MESKLQGESGKKRQFTLSAPSTKATAPSPSSLRLAPPALARGNPNRDSDALGAATDRVGACRICADMAGSDRSGHILRAESLRKRAAARRSRGQTGALGQVGRRRGATISACTSPDCPFEGVASGLYRIETCLGRNLAMRARPCRRMPRTAAKNRGALDRRYGTYEP